MHLAIILPVYNHLLYTKKALDYLSITLNEIDKTTYKIILVDDGSTDGTSEWVSANYPEVAICRGNGDLWWSGGVNMGIRYATEVLKTDYILLWNNDIRPATDYFIHLFGLLENNSHDHIILSVIYIENKSKKIISSKGGNFNPYTGKHALIGFGKEADTFVPPNLVINWFPGMGTVIHRSVFNKIGFFDEKNFPQYKGDADFGLRASKAGYKLTLSPGLELWNDRDNTGFSNDKSWLMFFRSLISRKSNANLYRDLLFYRRHAESILAYRELFRKYFAHIGGFFKWKFLGLFGLKKETQILINLL